MLLGMALVADKRGGATPLRVQRFAVDLQLAGALHFGQGGGLGFVERIEVNQPNRLVGDRDFVGLLVRNLPCAPDLERRGAGEPMGRQRGGELFDRRGLVRGSSSPAAAPMARSARASSMV